MRTTEYQIIREAKETTKSKLVHFFSRNGVISVSVISAFFFAISSNCCVEHSVEKTAWIFNLGSIISTLKTVKYFWIFYVFPLMYSRMECIHFLYFSSFRFVFVFFSFSFFLLSLFILFCSVLLSHTVSETQSK